jgi:signal transduction histidine kinase
MQLAENAAKHTSDGQEIAVGSSVDGAEARFWVRDSGRGIPVEEQEAIFRRLTRVEGVGIEGSGLGLAIVRAIAEAHHGRVELVSAAGEGSTFTLVVPVDQPHAEGAA